MAVLAPSLVRLRSEINQKWPRRDRSSDGWIGDTSHQRSGMPENGGSDHNPNRRGVVDALDIDVDGINVTSLVSLLIKHPAVNYVIWNRAIWSRRHGFKARRYTGSNPHTSHLHVSLIQSAGAENNATPWKVVDGPTVKPVTQPSSVVKATWAQQLIRSLPVLRKSPTKRQTVRKLQALLNIDGAGLRVDGVFGDVTDRAVRAYQKREHLAVDGVVGPKTWTAGLGPMLTTKQGDRGPTVRTIQALLKLFDAGTGIQVDGVFGAQTAAAVNGFQRHYELHVDGVVGPATWSALLTR
jgi:peptidoglycan hydrolase-like protein with peptidoglycan-binding domain